MSQDFIRLMHTLFLPATDVAAGLVWRPAADVQRTRDGFFVKYELAGVRAEDIDLQVLGSRMTLRGVRRDSHRQEGCGYFLMEIAYSDFERGLEFPCNLDRADIATSFRDGMLLVHIRTEGRP
jgi:HSP20 family protein